MKKAILLAVLPLSICVACNGKNEDKKLEEFNAKIESIVGNYQNQVDSLQRIAGLSGDALNLAHQQIYEQVIGEYKAYCLETIKKNRNNKVAVAALKEVYSDLGNDELKEVIASLGPKAKNDPDVQRIASAIAALDNTAEGKMFTDFEIDGVKFSDFIGRGKYVLVDFWASWCGPCKREIPNIAKVYETYAGDDFDVLSVAVWDKPEDTRKAAREHGVVWNQIINAQRIPTDIYGIQGIPQIMLFGPDGTILKRDLRGAGIEEAVKQALGK